MPLDVAPSPPSSPPSPSGLHDPRDWISAEHLNVAPALLGAALARPRRRLAAIAIDVSVVTLISNLGNLWLVAGASLAFLQWLRRASTDSMARRVAAASLATCLLGIGVWQFAVTPHELPHRGHLRTVDAADDDDRAEALASHDEMKVQKLRIAQLKEALADAREPKTLREALHDWLEDVGLGLGWAIAYFTLLPVYWPGQTLGKKLLGLRVVELTGKPIGLLRAFGRYGGYAAGLATGGFGFAQVWWDPNRQAIQDKTAHTVVIDLRRKLRAQSVDGGISVPHVEPSTEPISTHRDRVTTTPT